MSLKRKLGLVRSYLVYYGIPFRRRRMRRLYGLFFGPGDLVFDIGAHLGNRTAAWRSMGARVLAAEPNPDCLRVLHRAFGADPAVSVVAAAVGSRKGTTILHISRTYPTLATVSSEWIDRVGKVENFRGIAWEDSVEVEITTLDELIAVHGRPAFVKIDVEGFEAEVLAGLSTPPPALSFEFLPAGIESALDALKETQRLGSYEYNLSMVETMKLKLDTWVEAGAIADMLRHMPRTGRSGDVYARLRS